MNASADAGTATSLLGQRARLGCEPVGLDDPVDESDPQRLGRVDAVARHREFQGPPEPDDQREQKTPATVWHQADAREPQRETGVGGSDPDVAGQRERHADAGRDAVDRRNHRLGRARSRSAKAL